MHLLQYLVFENPLTLWLILGMAAVIAGVVWSRTGSRRAAIVASVCIVDALVLGLVAHLVETEHEKLLRTLEVMGRAVETGQADALIERISPAYSAAGGKDALASVVQRGLTFVRATAATPQIAERPGEATVTQTLRFSAAPGSRLPLPLDMQNVTWEGVFAPDPDGEWRLRASTVVQPQRMSVEQAARYLPR